MTTTSPAVSVERFIHLVPYSLERNIAAAYNEAIERVEGFQWIRLTDADVMFLVPD